MKMKQVIVIRKDINMSKGKVAAQAAHASCEAVFKIIDSKNKLWHEWLRLWREEGQMKVVLKVDSEEKLLEIFSKANLMKLPASLIIDAGHTQLPPGTKTAVAIGPAPEDLIDKITGSLKLY